jgi:hypothetical protein
LGGDDPVSTYIGVGHAMQQGIIWPSLLEAFYRRSYMCSVGVSHGEGTNAYIVIKNM